MKTIVTIERVGSDWVNYRDTEGISLSASNKKFPYALVGQVWEVTTHNSGQYPTGEIVSARILAPNKAFTRQGRA